VPLLRAGDTVGVPPDVKSTYLKRPGLAPAKLTIMMNPVHWEPDGATHTTFPVDSNGSPEATLFVVPSDTTKKPPSPFEAST
jgi:hypothetical protein